MSEINEGKTKCKHCGKWVSKDDSLEHEAGSLCYQLREEMGYTAEDLKEHRKSMTLEDVPEGYIKVAILDRICRKNGIPISRMVNAIGKDRSLEPPIHPWFQVVYVGNARWVREECASPEGLKIILGDKPVRKGFEERLAEALAGAGK